MRNKWRGRICYRAALRILEMPVWNVLDRLRIPYAVRFSPYSAVFRNPGSRFAVDPDSWI